MKFIAGRRSALALAAIVILIDACSPMQRPIPSAPMSPTSELVFTENEQIAGEIMAYLLQVVLGVAGAPEKRQAWSTRGIDLPLDFDMVSSRMYGPVPLRAELMVLDTNILGLSRVLYHYDPRLNLFKGTRDQQSLYPCTELMAIRLLLLQNGLSDRSKASFHKLCKKYDIQAVNTSLPIGKAIGRADVMVIGITDQGFAATIRKTLESDKGSGGE